MGAILRSSVDTRPWQRVRIGSGDPRKLLPGGARVRGSNIVPQAARQDWHWLWRDWLWTDWIKWQIDLLNSIGANTVRLMGTYKAIYDATLTEVDYHDRWRQVLDYVADLGMYFYPCIGGDFEGAYGYTPTTAFVADQAAAVAAVLRNYPNIIGIDIVQERQVWAKTEGPAVYSAVRAEIDVPLTFSISTTSSADLSNTTARAEIVGIVDFFDYHLNGHTLGATELTTAYWNSQRKPLLIGEYGAPQSLSTADQTARYDAINTNVALAPSYDSTAFECAGALSWAITDQDTVSSNQWGMFDTSGVARSHLTGAFASLPV